MAKRKGTMIIADLDTDVMEVVKRLRASAAAAKRDKDGGPGDADVSSDPATPRGLGDADLSHEPGGDLVEPGDTAVE